MRPIRLAILLVALTTPHSFAQNPPAPAATEAVVVEGKLKRFDLKVDGVSLTDLVNYLTDVTGENIVLLTPPNVDGNQIQVPPLKLKRVSLEQVLDLLTSVPNMHMEYDVSGDESRVIALRVLNMPPTATPDVDEPGQWAAAFQPAPAGAKTPGGGTDQPILTVLPLERLLLGENPIERVPEEAKRQELLEARTKQVLTLIDQAFTMEPHGQAKPEIKLHPETHTLLVKANPMQVQVVNSVLAALEVPGPSDAQKDYEFRLKEQLQNAQLQQNRMEQELISRLRMLEEKVIILSKERESLEEKARELEDRLRAEVAKQQIRPDATPAQPQ